MFSSQPVCRVIRQSSKIFHAAERTDKGNVFQRSPPQLLPARIGNAVGKNHLAASSKIRGDFHRHLVCDSQGIVQIRHVFLCLCNGRFPLFAAGCFQRFSDFIFYRFVQRETGPSVIISP